MLGQGCPLLSHRAGVRCFAAIIVAAWFALGGSCALAEVVEARLRFQWSGSSPQRWSGAITVADGEFAELQPLGTEADEAAALRLDGRRIIVQPLVRRMNDGCDVTIRADETALVTLLLHTEQNAQGQPQQFALGDLMKERRHAALDDFGGIVTIAPTPGDTLRVHIQRDHLVFNPGEPISFAVEPRLPIAGGETVTLETRLQRIHSSEILWQATAPYDPKAPAQLPIELQAPTAEGAYRLHLSLVKRSAGIAARLSPWDKGAELASRFVGFVVVDPQARLPRLVDRWDEVSTIDATSSSWWQRFPQWTQVEKLPGFTTPRPLGNVKPLISPLGHSFVELPPTSPADDHAWQAYLLPVRDVGQPHSVEIEVPRSMRQHLAISVIEPDAAGRVHAFGRDWGVSTEGAATETKTEEKHDGKSVDVHRIVFWPRTKSPAVVIANRSHQHGALYGKIRLLRQETVLLSAEPHAAPAKPRIAAAYIADPRFANAFGARGEHDGNRSVDSWHTFLTTANRLTQQLHAAGYNGAVISIAADGASLAPVAGLGNSPRFDSGLLASTGDDPLRKDILEVLFRIFDREGLTLTPAIELAAPLPALEALRTADAPDAIAWRGADGRTWHENVAPESAVAPHYNLLQVPVQQELLNLSRRLAARYDAHPSWGGMAIQLHGAGYGVLPGLPWGMDDETALAFAEQTGLPTPLAGDDRCQQRAALLLGEQLPQWKTWRRAQTTAFYRMLAQTLAARRPDGRLILCTEELFAGPEAAERLRQAIAGRATLNDVIEETGVDLPALATSPGIELLRPRRISGEASVDATAADLRINQSSELDQLFAQHPACGEQFFHVPAPLRLPSFDAQSPFGAEQTRFETNIASTSSGEAALRPLTTSLTARDFTMIVAGSDQFPLAGNAAHRDALRIFQELPSVAGDVRTERRQPVTMRIYREAESTTICLVNESPWPVELKIPLQVDGTLVWRRLGIDPAIDPAKVAADPALTGTLATPAKEWTTTLPPYGIQARRYSSRIVKVGAWTPSLGPDAQIALARRVADFEQRMARLDDERPYDQLQNPDFELAGEAGQMLGWQPRIGAAGIVDLAEETEPVTGRSLHLKSEDALGVAVQSHLFPIPSTGQMLVRARIRSADLEPTAQLYAWFEYQAGGATRQRYMALGVERQVDGQWHDYEFSADDLPMASDGQMRIQFHLVGHGEAWVDDVRLYDLRFTKDQRFQISKRLYAAKTALDDGQLMDCQRLIDGYWPRLFVEQTTPAAIAAKPAETPAGVVPDPDSATNDGKGLGPRLRDMVPRILR